MLYSHHFRKSHPRGMPWLPEYLSEIRSSGLYSLPFPFGTLVSVPFQSYDFGYERSQLIAELDQLNLQKVTLQSHWRDLEEEARRAGAYPGWLRRR